jgi:nucleotide-binding universal stress UspA family protein
MIERIVVGLDGSEIGEAALHQGAELAKRLDVPLHLIRIADVSLVRWGITEAAEAYAALSDEMREELDEANAYLASVAAPLEADGLTVTTETRGGFAARELVESVSPSDLLVVSSHGRHGLERWFIGSVAEEVARRSPAPVLIVRAA